MNNIPSSFPVSRAFPIIFFKLSAINNRSEAKIQVIYISKNSISTSHRNHPMPIKGASQVILRRKIISVYFKNPRKKPHMRSI